MTANDIRRLASALNARKGTPGPSVIKAVVTAVSPYTTPPTVTIAYEGETAPGIVFDSAYVHPGVGDVVLVLVDRGALRVLDRAADGRVRTPVAHPVFWTGTAPIAGTDVRFLQVAVTPRSTCNLKLDISLRFETDQGASGGPVEPTRVTFGYKVYEVGTPDVLKHTAAHLWHAAPQGHDTWNYITIGNAMVVDLPTFVFTGGVNYRLDFIGTDHLTLKTSLGAAIGAITEVYVP